MMRRTLIQKKIHSVELYNDDQIVGVVLAIHTSENGSHQISRHFMFTTFFKNSKLKCRENIM